MDRKCHVIFCKYGWHFWKVTGPMQIHSAICVLFKILIATQFERPCFCYWNLSVLPHVSIVSSFIKLQYVGHIPFCILYHPPAFYFKILQRVFITWSDSVCATSPVHTVYLYYNGSYIISFFYMLYIFYDDRFLYLYIINQSANEKF